MGGPASKLGKLVGYCARKAVTEALLKQEPIWACRTVLDRLKERHLPIEKLAAEISKVEGLALDAEEFNWNFKKESFCISILVGGGEDG